MAAHVLLMSKDKPPLFIIGWEESNFVQLFEPSNQNDPVGHATQYQSIINHMPYTEWQEFTDDDTQILQQFAAITQQAQSQQKPKQ